MDNIYDQQVRRIGQPTKENNTFLEPCNLENLMHDRSAIFINADS